MMRLLNISLLLALLFFMSCKTAEENVSAEEATVPVVVKTNPMKVYMHYMPWFQSKAVSGYWGGHWKMTNKNPDVMDETGKREIASHYYPLIGPYDSKDPDVIEYHLLLMKYAGVDGILIDWYGSHPLYDYQVNLTASNAVVDKLDEVGLQFAMVYEDYVADNIGKQTSKTALQAAHEDMLYAEKEYFVKPSHITIDKTPLMLTFGPRYFKLSSQWTEIFDGLVTKPKFLPLWNHSGYAGSNRDGEFAWVDFNESHSELTSFYNKSSLEILMGSAYPRFHDYYKEGGTGQSYGNVAYNNGETLRATLALAQSNKAKYIQLVTWNDYGEGTILEPTREDGFQCLEIVQQFTGVPYGKAELELVYDYYIKKKAYAGDTVALQTLGKIYQSLSSLDVDNARAMLNEL